MGRAFGFVLMLIALYIGMTIYTDGLENAFGGALAPIQPLQMRDSSATTGLSPAAQEADAPAERERRVWITDAVREQVTSDLQSGARRRGSE